MGKVIRNNIGEDEYQTLPIVPPHLSDAQALVNDVVKDFTMNFSKADGKVLGLDIVQMDDSTSLWIEAIDHTGGAAAYNLQAQGNKIIEPGDYIVKVNGNSDTNMLACLRDEV